MDLLPFIQEIAKIVYILLSSAFLSGFMAPANSLLAAEKQKESEITRFEHIVVKGNNQHMRGLVASRAHRFFGKLHQLGNFSAKTSPSPPLPLIIHLIAREERTTPPDYPVAIKVEMLAKKPHVLLYFYSPNTLSPQRRDYHLTEALLYSLALRSIDISSYHSLHLPPWLIEGMTYKLISLCSNAPKRLTPRESFDLKTLNIQAVLDLKESQRRALRGPQYKDFSFIASCLIEVLLKQEKGDLNACVAEMTTSLGDTRHLLAKYFPGMNTSSKSLEKWIYLQIQETITPYTTDILSIAQTEKHLDEALFLRDARTGKSQQLAFFFQEDATPTAESLLVAQQQLKRLSFRCFPSYTPFILRYIKLLSLLSHTNTLKKQTSLTTLSNLREKREKLLALNKRIEDYLNWFAITQVPASPQSLKHYLEAFNYIEKNSPSQESPLSTEHITHYLNLFEKHFVR